MSASPQRHPSSPSAARDPRVAAIERACRHIERTDEPPSLAALAASAGLSLWHFHRMFKGATGVTPKEYVSAHRAKRARAALEDGRSVTDAIYEAGFGSSGRFYEASDRMLGMTPTQYRAGGATTEIRFAIGGCSLGLTLVAASERGVCAILLGDEREVLRGELRRRFPRARLVAGDRSFAATVARVVACIETPRLGLDLPLDVRGTAFQHRVWRALRGIPPGTTATYAEIARRIGAPRAVRAVAGACAANPLAVAIPCHRVIRNDGELAGYRWGLQRKRALLTRESSK
ncbi:MAG TPA: bifunctional DNA-binding transcriptional regulator/O6-methylguanine-DNA methyltransferase Ada [Polyangia bacterium]|nr:bifunctional DNA-binding transcriptional regulator/O6-methylguanine-DNA methyltransferase Ada [Polyangia bacterium]